LRRGCFSKRLFFCNLLKHRGYQIFFDKLVLLVFFRLMLF